MDGAVVCWSCEDAKDGVGDLLSASGKVEDVEELGIVGEVGASVKECVP